MSLQKLRESRPERPRLEAVQVDAVLEYLPFPVRQVVEFIAETGCRPSEALRLESTHVSLDPGFVIFNLRKAGDNALVALTSRAVAAVRGVPQLDGCPYVFWNPRTRTRYRRINETFNRAKKKAGLDWLQLKDFRRAVAIAIAESGEPLHVAQAQLGHSSIRTTEQFYAHFSPEFAITRARAVLENRRDGRQTGGTPREPANQACAPSHGENSKVVQFEHYRKK